MKKTYPVSNKARAVGSWWKHLRKDNKRRVWKSTRKLAKREIQEIVDENLRT